MSGPGNLNIMYFVSKLLTTNLQGEFWSLACLLNQALSELSSARGGKE